MENLLAYREKILLSIKQENEYKIKSLIVDDELNRIVSKVHSKFKEYINDYPTNSAYTVIYALDLSVYPNDIKFMKANKNVIKDLLNNCTQECSYIKVVGIEVDADNQLQLNITFNLTP